MFVALELVDAIVSGEGEPNPAGRGLLLSSQHVHVGRSRIGAALHYIE